MSESNIELDNVPSKQATVDNDDNPVADTAIDKTLVISIMILNQY